MRNVWISSDVPFATWSADLDACRDRPADLVTLATAIVDAGERHRVWIPIALPLIDYQRARDGALGPRLEARWRDQRVLDLFGFTGAAMAPGADGSSTVEAELSWFDRDDRLVSGRVSDPGALLHSLEPFPGALEYFTYARPPVRATGLRWTYDAAGAPTGPEARRPLAIRFALHADVWMPFVFGSAHPLADHEHHFDNRPLAREHTPRLNAFLAEVAALVTRVGGAWSVDEDETSQDAIRWVGPGGIDLDAEAPALFPPEAADQPWA